MKRIPATSPQATQALALVEALQTRFVQGLEKLCGTAFTSSEWFRDEGLHGGGRRFGIQDNPVFGRASVNVSQVHYDDDAQRRLGSASALSTIVHPVDPHRPSVHIHLSWTELKTGQGYWRMMADLNPALPNAADKDRFADALKAAAPQQFAEAAAQGDCYFYIPVLQRHRGVTHFYLESYSSGHFEVDRKLARAVGEAAIDTYLDILAAGAGDAAPPSDADLAAQLAYHTLYFFQVLTLDRGTTTGLMVHDQNDVGILGSLPPRVDKNLLQSWVSRMPLPQDRLLDRLIRALPNTGVCVVDDEVKLKLCRAVREHYQQFPEALELQASGSAAPPTVENHL